MIKKLLSGVAVAVSLFTLSAPASAALVNWFIDTDGPGGNAAVHVADYIDLVGAAYVHNTFTSASTFSFNEVARLTTSTADGGTLVGGLNLSPSLSSYFVGSGTGTIGGDLTFNAGGTLNVFSGSTAIANFKLLQGSAVLQANSTLPNGTVSLIFQATNFATGYFFDQFMHDLAPIANSPTGLVLGFATTNAISLAPTPISSLLLSDYNASFNPKVSSSPFASNNTTDLYLSNNGQFRLAVPEPSVLSLLGIALLGLGFSTRRKLKA